MEISHLHHFKYQIVFMSRKSPEEYEKKVREFVKKYNESQS